MYKLVEEKYKKDRRVEKLEEDLLPKPKQAWLHLYIERVSYPVLFSRHCLVRLGEIALLNSAQWQHAAEAFNYSNVSKSYNLNEC